MASSQPLALFATLALLSFSPNTRATVACRQISTRCSQATRRPVTATILRTSPRQSPNSVQRSAMSSNASSSSGKRSLLSLPISPHAPIYHLPPDPLFPTPASLLHLAEYDAPPEFGQDGPVALKEGDPVPPSMLRRSRQIRRGGCFTYVSPRE